MSAGRALARRHRAAQVRECKVIQHDDVGAGGQRLVQNLRQVFGLHFDAQAGQQLSRIRDRAADRAGRGDVVVLDQDAVVQAPPVVAAAAAAHRVLLRARRPGRVLRVSRMRPRAGTAST